VIRVADLAFAFLPPPAIDPIEVLESSGEGSSPDRL